MKKDERVLKRIRRARAKVRGTKVRPRLSVFRSNKYIYAQLIDDSQKKTLIGVSEKKIEEKNAKKMSKKDRAKKLGMYLAQKATVLPAGKAGKKIKKVVFDRGGYAYKGRVKALAEGAREGGLEF